MRNKLIKFLGGYTKKEYSLKENQLKQLSDILLAVTDAMHNYNERRFQKNISLVFEEESSSSELIRDIMINLRLLSSYRSDFLQSNKLYNQEILDDFCHYMSTNLIYKLSSGKISFSDLKTVEEYVKDLKKSLNF